MKAIQTILFFAVLIIAGAVKAQNISGQYYGIGNVVKDGNYSQYLSELILSHKGNRVSGEYNYYFKSTYIASKVKGTYDKESRVLSLEIFPLLNFKAASNKGADCPMRGTFILKLSKIETTLTGEFESIDAYKYTCPSIFIRLKKEDPSDDNKRLMELARSDKPLELDPIEGETNPVASIKTEEPPVEKVHGETQDVAAANTSATGKSEAQQDAKNPTIPAKLQPNEKKIVAVAPKIGVPVKAAMKPGTKNEPAGKAVKDSALANTKPLVSTEAKPLKSQQKQDTILQSQTATINNSTEKQQLDRTKTGNTTTSQANETKTMSRRDTVPFISPAPAKRAPDETNLAQVTSPKDDTAMLVTRDLLKRSFEESPIIEVESDSLQIAIYDNGEVDGDSVALFHNRSLLLRNQLLSDKPIYLKIGIDTTVHEISMFAENLGTMPPNTAVCIIMAGGKRYELVLSSNYIRNGTIRFRKKTQAQIEREKQML